MGGNDTILRVLVFTTRQAALFLWTQKRGKWSRAAAPARNLVGAKRSIAWQWQAEEHMPTGADAASARFATASPMDLAMKVFADINQRQSGGGDGSGGGGEEGGGGGAREGAVARLLAASVDTQDMHLLRLMDRCRDTPQGEPPCSVPLKLQGDWSEVISGPFQMLDPFKSSPEANLEALLRATKAIHAVHEARGGKQLATDDFFPIFMYCVVQVWMNGRMDEWMIGRSGRSGRVGEKERMYRSMCLCQWCPSCLGNCPSCSSSYSHSVNSLLTCRSLPGDPVAGMHILPLPLL